MFYKGNTAILIRVAFILGNLTTTYVETRTELAKLGLIDDIFELVGFYLTKDIEGQETTKEIKKEEIKSKKYEEFNAGNIEDALIKLIRLFANVLTDKEFGSGLDKKQAEVSKFLESLLISFKRKNLERNEDCLLNGISCITNLLFYDTPSSPIILGNDLRKKVRS